ncbi:glycosyl hydrolases family 15-domain-containing protein [Chytridium lagenaria]|nr:glycosyl hydrolases family 15-domain-containing protein [Chytridium lagenaria]
MSRARHNKDKLDVYFNEVASIILTRQNPATGLIPASVAITTHGDYRDAWVRDNVYSIMAVWGLALAYRRIDDDGGRSYELEHATIKCMRGLLFSMMRQADKVELFKNTQHVEHALHAKYNTNTGDTVVGDREWGHLQIDATSLFLLQLAQMTASGLKVVYTLDEVNFIQNLVFYIERAYRTPDYGIWERGNKLNHGHPELNSSSIGMAVAALQAINGLNLFGARGGPTSVIHVLPDEITRNYTTLHSALPRESNSKEVDAAVLSVISYPAFAVGDIKVVNRTRNEIVKKLGGRFGFKRFLRDGHQTVLEDTSRLHYDPHELRIFEGIECEWPLFFTYMILDGFFRDDKAQVEEYRRLLEPLLIDSSSVEAYRHASQDHSHHNHGHKASLSQERPNHRAGSRMSSVPRRSHSRPPAGTKLVPELYIVPKGSVADEKAEQGSVNRIPNENVPLVWAQSLYILGSLLKDDLLSPGELDPLGRRFLPYRPKQGNEVVVQVVLLSESAELQAKLATFGLETQTVEACSPITISPPSALRDAYMSLGENTKLKLTGRPKRPMGTLSTSKLYRCQGRLYAFLPHFMDKEEFYLVSDNNYLVSLFEQEIAFVKNHWWSPGRPTMIIMLTREMLGGIRSTKNTNETQRWRYNAGSNSKRNLLNFMMSLRSGICNGVRVRVGRLGEMINTSCIESLDFLVSSDVNEEEDWASVLQGEWSRPDASKKLQLSDQQSPVGPPAHHHSHGQRSRSLRRRSSGDLSGAYPHTPIGSRSPLKSPYYSEEPFKYDMVEKFKLRDHVDDMVKLDLGPSATNASAGVAQKGPSASISASANNLHADAISSPVARAKSPIRGLSSNRLTRGSFADGTTSTGSMAKDPSTEEQSLSRRSSYSFDMTDDARGVKGKVTVDVSTIEYRRMSMGSPLDAPPPSATSIDTPLPYEKGTNYLGSTPASDVVMSPTGDAAPSLDILTLTLGDPSHVESAVTLLKSSANLYDQIDLLHYLHSCLGGENRLDGLGTIDVLLEEVYVKAMGLKLWSIVRQAAGLLKKVVNSLTINITDLLIRSKPVTVGLGPQEFAITNPLSPEVLSEIIYRHCASDVREAPLVQEIVTYLGSLIRSSPGLFEGIQRIQISRMRGCDEEEAIELLMQLSPYELKSLLATVLSTREQTSMSTLSRWRSIQVQNNGVVDNPLKMSTTGIVLPSSLTIATQSGGFAAGNFAKVEILKDGASVSLPAIFGRGLNIIVLDPLDGSLVETAAFDSHISSEESDEFAKMIEWLEPGMIVLVVAKDDATEHLSEAAKTACESLGSAKIRDVRYRDSWCLIGEKGADRGSVPETHRAAHLGPTEMIHKSIDLVARRKKMLAAFPSQSQAKLLTPGSSASPLMPSNGKWLRRRKNDGALNRAPPDFYPKVWHVLNKCQGIAVGREFLPRDPTVSEKTPEEFNFALQIEYLLDAIRDPAERQCVVECLVVISRISERNPEIRLNAGPLDLMRVIRDAVSRFWARCVKEQTPGSAAALAQEQSVSAENLASGQSQQSPNDPRLSRSGLTLSITPSTSNSNLAAITDLTFDKNERLARRLFFDLPQDGKDGTMSYLAESCVRLCFDVQWAGDTNTSFHSSDVVDASTATV